MKSFLILVFSSFLMSSSFAKDAGPTTVREVDINRYIGKWYEIAKYENSFQKKCGATTAEYALKKGLISVTNSCKNKKTGELTVAEGTARAVNEENSKLKVSFVPYFQRFGWFAGDYWIIGLGNDYEYAVVGNPTREYLWFLSRTPSISAELFEELKGIARDQGYDVEKLTLTPKWE